MKDAQSQHDDQDGLKEMNSHGQEPSKYLKLPDLKATFKKYGYTGEMFDDLGRELADETADKWSHPGKKIVGLPKEYLDSPYLQLLKNVDLINCQYWIKKFSTFDENRINWSWNWPSFFFGPFRYLIKGIIVKAFLYTLYIIVFSIMLNGIINDKLSKYILTGLAGIVLFGIMGAHDYFRFCIKYKDNYGGAILAQEVGHFLFFILIVLDLLFRLF